MIPAIEALTNPACATPGECEADEHYCAPWLDAGENGPLFCRCGQELRAWEVRDADETGVSVYTAWAVDTPDADPYILYAAHDVWYVHRDYLSRYAGACQGART